MARLINIFAIILILLGIGGYFVTGMQSITALIPTFFGIILLLLGFVAKNEKRNKIAGYSAAVVGVLGFAGTVSGIPKFISYLNGAVIARPPAVIVQTIMAVLCLVLILLLLQKLLKKSV